MTEKIKALSDAIDQLAIQIVLIEPDDLIGLGNFLNQVEEIERMNLEQDLESMGSILKAIKEIVKKIILNEIKEPQKGFNAIGRGLKIIQVKISNSNGGQTHPEEELFWKETKSIIDIDFACPINGVSRVTEMAPDEETLDLSQDVGLLKDFVAEALEHLESIELNLISLEQSPGDKERINAIFRPFHTIKGVSGFLNLRTIHQFSHAVESLLDHARNDKLRINQNVIDFILEAVDLLKNMIIDLKVKIDSGQTFHSDYPLEPYLDKIANLLAGEVSEERLEELEDISIDEHKQPPLGEILISKGVLSEEEVSEALKIQKENKSNLKLGEILIQERKVKPREIVDAIREQRPILNPLSDSTLKVDSKKLDNLVDLVGELVIAQSLVEQNSAFASLRDQKLMQDFSQLKRITNELQRISMSLRMIPIRQTFQKMTRLVRDLARKSGKQVELVMSGEDTEIDRHMVESLYDPLVHMIRNAMDHGIETPAQRSLAGKEETGKIFLRAYQKGGNVIIELEDDGQGLDREKILNKAMEKGILPQGVQFNDYQIDNLIFESGFSTADQVTDVSGRGVGMDVVKKAIEKLRGKVEIFSTWGKGCRFTIRVPLTLAIMDGMIVRVGEEQYIIPALFIRETFRPRFEEITTVQKRRSLVKVRDRLLPLIRLHRLLGVAPQKDEPWEALIIVVENEGVRKCLMVDDLIGKQEVVIKNLGERLKEVKGVAGATIMGDGHVGLILDIHGIFEMDEKGV